MKKLASLMLALAVCLSLAACGGGSEPAAPSATPSTPATPAAAAEAEGVSDENWSILQSNYQVLVDAHTQIVEIYSSDEIKANPELEELMNQAADLITEMGEIDRDEVTEENCHTLNEAMKQTAEALDLIASALEPASLLDSMTLIDIPNLDASVWEFAGGYVDGREMTNEEAAQSLAMYGGELFINFEIDQNGGDFDTYMMQGYGMLSGARTDLGDGTLAVTFDNSGTPLNYVCAFADLDDQLLMLLIDESGENAIYFVPSDHGIG